MPLAVVARMTRSAMLEVLGEDYIRTARAKGLSAPRVVIGSCAAQRADPGGHRDRPAGRHAAGRRDPDRDDLLLAGRRPLAGRFDRSGATTRSCRAALLLIATLVMLVNLGVDLTLRVAQPADPPLMSDAALGTAAAPLAHAAGRLARCSGAHSPRTAAPCSGLPSWCCWCCSRCSPTLSRRIRRSNSSATHFLDAADAGSKAAASAFRSAPTTLGRDVLSRLIYGARLSLLIGIAVVTLSLSIGIVLGPHRGFAGGWIDTAIMRLMDIVLVFPSLLLAHRHRRHPRAGSVQCDDRDRHRPAAQLHAAHARRGVAEKLARDYVIATRCRRRRHAAADVRHRPAELPGAADRAGDSRLLHRHPGRGGAGLPRPGRAAADAGVGHDARRARCEFYQRAWWV